MDEKAKILNAELQECYYQINKKEHRMRLFFSIEYPRLQRSEKRYRRFSGLLAPLGTLLTPRKYKNENREEWVDAQVSKVMDAFYDFWNECVDIEEKLEGNFYNLPEMETKITWLRNKRVQIFNPTIADMEMAKIMGDKMSGGLVIH